MVRRFRAKILVGAVLGLMAAMLSGCASPGSSVAQWEPAPSFSNDPRATEIPIRLVEKACASGDTASGRILPPSIEYHENELVVTIRVASKAGGATCEGNPVTSYTVRLAEPLGRRAILDGGAPNGPVAPRIMDR